MNVVVVDLFDQSCEVVNMAVYAFLVVVVSLLFNVQGHLIWPQVAESKYGIDDVTVLSTLEFQTVGGQDVKTLTAAYERYKRVIFTHVTGEGASGALSTVKVEVEDMSEDYPQLETDESYELSISSDGEAYISAKTVYGALRGLESFSQLVLFDFEKELYYVPNCPVFVKDAPRYPHRGLLLDTSRHFQPIAEIERTIDSLSYAKYNGNYMVCLICACH